MSGDVNTMSTDETVGGLLRQEPDDDASKLNYTPKQLDIIRAAMGNPDDSPAELVERMESDDTMENVSMAYVRNVLQRISRSDISDDGVIEMITEDDDDDAVTGQEAQRIMSPGGGQTVSLLEGEAEHPPDEDAITIETQIPATVRVIVDRTELEQLANVSLSLKPTDDGDDG